MKNAAMILGVIAGLCGMLVGFFSWGYTAFIDWFGPVEDVLVQADNVAEIRFLGVLAPILAIAGGAMSLGRPLVAAPLLLLSAAATWHAFDWNLFTAFPIAMSGLAALLAIGGARSPRAID